jgi:hypothetical protein
VFTDNSGLEEGRAYVYRVRATRGAERGPASDPVTVSSSQPGDAIVYNGNATVLTGPDGTYSGTQDNVLRLTENQFGQAGSAFTAEGRPIVSGGVQSLFGGGLIEGFTAQFDFSIQGTGQPADGIAFVIQRGDSTALGQAGSGLGYMGIGNSIAVKYDIYPNFSPNQTGIYADGYVDDLGTDAGLFFADGRTYRVELEYRASESAIYQRITALDEFGNPSPWEWTEYYFSDASAGNGAFVPLDLVGYLGGNSAFFGFTGATGGLSAEQTVRNFFLNGEAIPFTFDAPDPDNQPPVAVAGNYNILEGQGLTLDGSASFDPEGNPLNYQWDINRDGTFDAFGPVVTLTPEDLRTFGITDGTHAYFVNLVVDDGKGSYAGDSGLVWVYNAPPTGDFSGGGPVIEGSEVTVGFSSATDPSQADVDAGLRYSFALDRDLLSTDYASASTDPTATFTMPDSGTPTVWGAVIDRDGGYTVYSTQVTVTNVAPTATFNGTLTVNEGDAAQISFADESDSAGDVAAGFSYYYSIDLNGDGQFDLSEGFRQGGRSASLTFADEGVYAVRGRVYDADGGYTEYAGAVTVRNVAPVLDPVSAPAGAQDKGTDVIVGLNYFDQGVNDSHTVTWDWGDGSTTPGTTESFANGMGAAHGTHRYAAGGMYTVTATVSDGDGGTSSTTYQYVVVVDRAAQVAGSGTVQVNGQKATFDFSARYKGATGAPTGQVVFKVGSLSFRSTTLEWLAVGGNKVYLRGAGTVNGQAGYTFQLTFIDGSPDRLRMKVWNTSTGEVVVDNQPGALDGADPTALLTGGNVSAHG